LLRRKGLVQVSDVSAIEKVIDENPREQPGTGEQFKSGKQQVLASLLDKP